MHADQVNGAPPEKPISKHYSSSDCVAVSDRAAMANLVAVGFGTCNVGRYSDHGNMLAVSGACRPDEAGFVMTFDARSPCDDHSTRLALRASISAEDKHADPSGTMTGTHTGRCC